MRLIPEWRKAYRLFSVQAMAVATAILGAWLVLPDDLQATLPHWIPKAAAQISGRPNVRVVNVNAQLSNASGLLKDEYADDNEHLNANGQLNVLAPAVVDALKSLGVV